jgi:hypothetical protein
MRFGTGSGRHQVFIVCVVAVFCGSVLISGCEKGEKSAAEKQATEKTTSRVSFWELFDVNASTVKPKKIIRVDSTTMTPDVPFEIQDMRIYNAPFSDFIGHDAEVRQAGGVCEIVKFY